MQLDMDEILNIDETVVTISGYRRRTTVPSVIYKRLKLREGDKLRWILRKDGTIIIMKVQTESNTLAQASF